MQKSGAEKSVREALGRMIQPMINPCRHLSYDPSASGARCGVASQGFKHVLGYMYVVLSLSIVLCIPLMSLVIGIMKQSDP